MQLGGAGIIASRVFVDEQMPDGTPIMPEVATPEEHETLPEGPVANRSDFQAFAEEEAMYNMVGRSWNLLARLYYHKAIGQNGDIYRYQQQSPLVYYRVPPLDTVKQRGYASWCRLIGDLDVRSLARQLEVVDKAIEEYGEDDGPVQALGRQAGRRTVSFLRYFVSYSLEQWERHNTTGEPPEQ